MSGDGSSRVCASRAGGRSVQSVPWLKYRGGVSGCCTGAWGGTTAAARCSVHARRCGGRRSRRRGGVEGRQGRAAVWWTRSEGAGGLKLKVRARRKPNREADRPGRCSSRASLYAASARCWAGEGPVRGRVSSERGRMEAEGERRAGWVWSGSACCSSVRAWHGMKHET